MHVGASSIVIILQCGGRLVYLSAYITYITLLDFMLVYIKTNGAIMVCRIGIQSLSLMNRTGLHSLTPGKGSKLVC